MSEISSNSRKPVVALGMRFHPADEELIRYLLKFVSCKSYSCDNIRLEDLYGNKKPWEIFESNLLGDEDAKNVRYFFTKLKKKKSDGTRFIRTVIRGGFWKGLDCEKSVYDGLMLVGSKKNYRYQYKGYQTEDVVWTMREYSLDDKILKALRRRGLIHYEDVVLCCVKSKINVHARDHKELGTTNFQDSCPVYPLTSSEQNNAFQELQQDQNSEQLIKQLQIVDEIVPSAFHDSYQVYPFTSSKHYAFHELQQNQNSKELNVVQENNIEETTPFSQYHNDDVTSYLEEGTTNIQDCNVDCYTGADFSSTFADLMMNHMETQPQLPIYNDESANDYQLLQQIITCPMAQESTCVVLNGGITDAAVFVSGQRSTCCEELQQDQTCERVNIVQENNIEEAVPFAQYHNDDVTSYSEEEATNFQDYNIDCNVGANFSSTLADLLNDIGTQPQLPIFIDEYGYDYQLAQ
ncbi:hypothetical protein CQW23_02924 [Capsicum baccatum]|uniref:NAC domain-containing protein n=1 Tax=Capsicum baccatum TaxID=33114 RepID=A0A2G2XT62_CAPBA|nr:hypothetical protein CQW23_02924 [Capsicum baccatum]